MGKTRSCRRTEDENKIHDKAVKMRKMTDEQLVHYVEDRVEKARSEGFNQGKKAAPESKTFTSQPSPTMIFFRLGFPFVKSTFCPFCKLIGIIFSPFCGNYFVTVPYLHSSITFFI